MSADDPTLTAPGFNFGQWYSFNLPPRASQPEPRTVPVDDFVRTCDDLRQSAEIPTASVDQLVADYYAMPDNGAGGTLHVTLDDSNWEDDSIQGCIAYAEERSDRAGVALGRLLLTLPMRQRLDLACVCPCCIDELRAELLGPS